MATYTPNESTVDERIRKAWAAYRDDIADLDGAAYDAAEEESWQRLQEKLEAIEADRASAGA